MPRVFVNYRREDSAGIAGQLFDRLCVELGRENVFRDLDTLVPGADFAKVIADQVASCDALVAVIGKGWLTARDSDGNRRLDDPGDFVKAEIREALALDKLVIPALVEGASLLEAADLPPDIAALANRNAIEISDSRFAYDTESLIRAVQAHTDGAQDPRSRPAKQHRWWAWVSDPDHQRTLRFIGAGIAAAAVAVWAVYDKVTPVAPPGVSASNGGIAAGRDVTAKAGPGGTAIVATGPVTTGISLEQHEERLKRREQEVRKEIREAYARTYRADTDKIALLEKERAAAEAKRQNPEQALSDLTAKLAEASQALEKLKGDLPADQLAEARQALSKGDTAAAEALFTEALAQGKAQAVAGNEKAADAAFQLGELAYQRIDYARAYGYYLEAAKLQPDNPEYVNTAGRIAYHLARYAKAEPLYQRALALREKTLGPEDPDVATSLNDLAVLYKTQGKYADAELLYQRSLKIREKVLGSEHPEVATSLHNLGALYYEEGDYQKAKPLFERALTALGKAPSSRTKHLEMTDSLNALAELYRAQGKNAEAELLYQRSLKIREKVLGSEHPAVATSLNNLAGLYYDQGQYEKAEPLFQRSLFITEKVLGSEHPNVATSLNNLAAIYNKHGEYAKAEPLLERAQGILEKTLGPDHPKVAQGLNNLAVLYHAQGQYAKAEPLYQRALRIQEATLPSDHPVLAQAMENYAALLGQLNRDDEAKAWQAKAEVARERHAGTNPGAK